MINQVVVVGRLTKEPQLTYTPSGIPKARFTVAVNRQFSNQQGERDADFVGCIAWRKAAENLANFMKKGSLIGVTGRIQTGSFEGQDGKTVYTTDVIAESIQFLESRSNGSQAPNPATSNQPNTNYQTQPQGPNTGQYSGQNQYYGNQYQNNYPSQDPFTNNGQNNGTNNNRPF